MGANRGLLVDLLHFARIEDEGLLAFTTEDQHVRAVELNTAERLRAHKL